MVHHEDRFAITNNDFAQILSTIDGLSFDQMRALARVLETRIAALGEQPTVPDLTAAELADQEVRDPEPRSSSCSTLNPAVEHSAQAGFLGNLLTKIQRLVNAMGQTTTRLSTASVPLPRNFGKVRALAISPPID